MLSLMMLTGFALLGAMGAAGAIAATITFESELETGSEDHASTVH